MIISSEKLCETNKCTLKICSGLVFIILYIVLHGFFINHIYFGAEPLFGSAPLILLPPLFLLCQTGMQADSHLLCDLNPSEVGQPLPSANLHLSWRALHGLSVFLHCHSWLTHMTECQCEPGGGIGLVVRELSSPRPNQRLCLSGAKITNVSTRPVSDSYHCHFSDPPISIYLFF